MNFLMPSVPLVASISAWVVKNTLSRAAPATGTRSGRVIAVTTHDGRRQAGIAELLDDGPDVVGHRGDVVEVRLLRQRLDLGDLGREVGGLVVVDVLEHDGAARGPRTRP